MSIGSRLERALGILALASTAGASASSDVEQAFVAKEAALGNSCVPSVADSSGIAGWYTPPVEILLVNVQNPLVFDAKIGGNVLALGTTQGIRLYGLSANGLPPVLKQTYNNFGGNLAVSPSGNEVANSAGQNSFVFSRKVGSVWSQPQFLPGLAVAYSPDGTELAVTGLDQTVRIGTRNAQGNWELGLTIALPKPDGSFGSELVWTQDRLVISSNSLLYAYRKASGAYELAQVLPNQFERLSEQRFGNKIIGNGGHYVVAYPRNASGFQRGQPDYFPINAFGVARGLSGQKIAGFGNRFLSGECALHPVFFVSNQANPGSNKLVLTNPGTATDAFDFDGRSAVMVVQGPAPSFTYRVYFTTRDRIFGGNAPEPGEDGVGPGGFE